LPSHLSNGYEIFTYNIVKYRSATQGAFENKGSMY